MHFDESTINSTHRVYNMVFCVTEILIFKVFWTNRFLTFKKRRCLTIFRKTFCFSLLDFCKRVTMTVIITSLSLR